jgi:hypothetical protein
MSIYNNLYETPQHVYDSFNTLVFSNDTRVIHKMITKIKLYNEIKHLNGDILEFGVFKGASLALWLQLIKLYEFNALTSVIGFDYFDKDLTLNNLENASKKLMSDVLNRVSSDNELKMEVILDKCNNILPNKIKLIKGDACETSISLRQNNPGLRTKLMYLDMDVDKPTFEVLINLWDTVVLDGIIVLDEYGFHAWDESNGVDRFLKTIKGKYVLENTGVIAPTLVIKKIDF